MQIIRRDNMRIAIIGSRNKNIENLEKYLPDSISEIISGGAKGIDTTAKNYALAHQIKLTEFLPEYSKYGKSAPLKRNQEIVNASDLIIAFWDGQSRGTKYAIDYAISLDKEIKIVILK